MDHKYYLGLDVGSVSIKIAKIDEEENLVDSIYLKNHGLVETIKEGLEYIIGDSKISAIGVTGSGRKFVGMFIGADMVKTEILAHSVGTLKYHPDVRTLMDIGGEDSKLLLFSDGVLNEFKMNSICSAGTGSFIESIAEKLGVKIEDVGYTALKSRQRIDFPSKCGVFTQSAVVSKRNSGASKEDILNGVCRSLVSNYLTMAKGIDLEPPYVFQGATAKNIALVKSFEEQLGHEVIVPKYCDIMGAIGIGLMAKRAGIEDTVFKGLEILAKDYRVKSVHAKGCDNRCELTQLYEDNKYVGCIGNKCDKCVK